MPYPLIELGGSGRPVVLLPANGFPPDTYGPALEPLCARFRVVSLPPRALWDDAGPAPSEPGTWITLAEDALEGMRRHGLSRAIVIGHSFGAVTGLLAAARGLSRFRALALLDPTIPPPGVMAEFREQRARGEGLIRPLVQRALARRSQFDSVEEGFAYWRGKPFFADWSDAALLRYARAMLHPADDGGLVLAWPPEWEAHYYASIYTETWEELGRLDLQLDLLVVRGEHSDTFVPEAAALLREALPYAEQRVIRGHGHLFPQSAPEETGRILAEWLRTYS